MRHRGVVLLACALAASACSGRRADKAPPKKHDAAIALDAAAAVEVEVRPLGLPDLASYQWRRRGGHAAYRKARAAEAVADWPAVVASCRQALAADPGHLEAAWLLAAALGRLSQHQELLGPLQLAVAGDFGKWGTASLELAALESFRATSLGAAWRRRVEQDRNAYATALARSLFVSAGGDLYAFDPELSRWYRLTRTYGAVVGALRVPAANRIVYVTRQRRTTNGKKATRVAVGAIDLVRGRAGRTIDLGGAGPITLAYSTTKHPGIWIGAGIKGGPKPIRWRRIGDHNKLVALPRRTARPSGAYLEVVGRNARLRALPVLDVTADWDDGGLASAIRIGKSNRVITVPSPGLIDGNTVTWSPDRSRLAFVAQLDDRCEPGAINAIAYVADAATGQLQELVRGAEGLAIEWVTERKLVTAGDRGVSVLDLDGAAPAILDGADGLIAPRRRPTCSPPEPDPVIAEDPDPTPPESGDDATGDADGEPNDAGVAGTL